MRYAAWRTDSSGDEDTEASRLLETAGRLFVGDRVPGGWVTDVVQELWTDERGQEYGRARTGVRRSDSACCKTSGRTALLAGQASSPNSVARTLAGSGREPPFAVVHSIRGTAALLAAEIFKHAAGVLPGRMRLHAHLSFCPVTLFDDLSRAPECPATAVRLGLIGVGAVGTASARILSGLPPGCRASCRCVESRRQTAAAKRAGGRRSCARRLALGRCRARSWRRRRRCRLVRLPYAIAAEFAGGRNSGRNAARSPTDAGRRSRWRRRTPAQTPADRTAVCESLRRC